MTLALTGAGSANADNWLSVVQDMPSIGHASIEGPALILFPDTTELSWPTIKSKTNALCKKAAARGIHVVFFMDSDIYMNSGQLKVKHRKTCIG